MSDGRRGTWNQHGSQTLRLSQADGTLTLEGIAEAIATALHEAFMKEQGQ